MPDKRSSIEKAYEAAIAGKNIANAAKAAKQNAANAAKKKADANTAKKDQIFKVDPRESDGTFNKKPNPGGVLNPVIGVPRQPKTSNPIIGVPKQPKPAAKRTKAAPLDPNFGMPAAKKPSPAKGMPY